MKPIIQSADDFIIGNRESNRSPHEILLDAAKEALCHLDPDCHLDGVKLTAELSEREKMIVELYDAVDQFEVLVQP